MRFSYLGRAAIATLFLLNPAQAQTIGTCITRPGEPDNCAPLVACVEATGVYFMGRAVGHNAGTLAGELSNGAFCTGEWVSRNWLGTGQADFTCDDGQWGRAYFTYLHMPTGTATGRGLTNRGQSLRVWAGHEIRAFLRAETGAPDPKLFCNTQEIPIS
jgi:hypothetical protein